jgi:hypothetical protein
MRAPAQVVRGLRTPESVPETQTIPTEHQPVASFSLGRPAADGERVYHSHTTGLIVQITSPADRFDPATGSIVRAHPIKAQFQAVGEGALGEFRTKDPEVMRVLEANPRYGLGRSYWRADEFMAKARESMRQQVKSQLTSDPELLAEVLQEVGSAGGEFELPPSQ